MHLSERAIERRRKERDETMLRKILIDFHFLTVSHAGRGTLRLQIAYSWPIVPLHGYGRQSLSKAKALVANIKLQQQRNGPQPNWYIVPPPTSSSVIAAQTCTVSSAGLLPSQQQQQQYSTLASVLAVKFIPKLLQDSQTL